MHGTNNQTNDNGGGRRSCVSLSRLNSLDRHVGNFTAYIFLRLDVSRREHESPVTVSRQEVKLGLLARAPLKGGPAPPGLLD